ncbi:hypothetical protein IQ277_36250 [Nostocales cyanobacterium LEGE 12452]|nr:hypothetical protein [Nostocales cyanobacterium LEGE 12452]
MNLIKNFKKKWMNSWPLASLLFIGIATACSYEEGEFYIADVSKQHTFTDSASFHPDCCVATYVTGTLDAPALIIVEGYLIGGFIDSLHLPKGKVNIENSHGDFYGYRKIAIKYYPGEAKKGSLKIKTLIY